MTLLFHVDESSDAKHFFNAGVLSDGATAAQVELALLDLVDGAYDSGHCTYNAELHGTDLFGGTRDWSRSKTEVQARVDVYEAALELLQPNGIEVIAHGANLEEFRKRYGNKDPEEWEFTNLLERLNERLKERSEVGLVISDDRPHHRGLQWDFAHAKRWGTGGYRHQVLDHIIDAAHLVDSRLSRMVQLADLVAVVLRRRSSFPQESDPRMEAAMTRLFGLVMAAVPDPTGRYVTVRW